MKYWKCKICGKKRPSSKLVIADSLVYCEDNLECEKKAMERIKKNKR